MVHVCLQADIVRLVKTNMVPAPLTLAIGDGANDVSMIQASVPHPCTPLHSLTPPYAPLHPLTSPYIPLHPSAHLAHPCTFLHTLHTLAHPCTSLHPFHTCAFPVYTRTPPMRPATPLTTPYRWYRRRTWASACRGAKGCRQRYTPVRPVEPLTPSHCNDAFPACPRTHPTCKLLRPQAVRAADYAIGQFAHLQRLLLVHGFWNYQRVSFVVLYTVYKQAP